MAGTPLVSVDKVRSPPPAKPAARWGVAVAQQFAIRRAELLALGLASAYFLTFSALSIARHATYHSFGYDLGVFNQAFWNTTQGRPFESTLAQGISIPHSFFGDHFSPILWALLPFYYVFPHPETLLVLQTLALALTAWPIFLLARFKLGPGHALVWVVAYFLFVPLAHINLDDFHEIALAPLPLALALYFLEREKYWLYLLWLVVAFLVKEEVALIGIGFGAYVLFGKRDLWWGIGTIGLSIGAFVSTIYVFLPFFAGGASYPYIGWRYSEVGGTPLGIVRTLATNPLGIAHALAQAKKVYFVIAMMGPVLGLSALAGWATLLILPTFGYLLLSDDVAQFSFTTHYSAPLIPLILGTAVIAQSRFRPGLWRGLSATVLASSLVFCFLFGDLPGSLKFEPTEFLPQSRYDAFVPKLAMIPGDARVLAENDLSSHLADRRYIYDIDYEGVNDAQWVVLDVAGTKYNQAAYQTQVKHFAALGYVVVAEGDGLVIMHRN